MPDQPETAPAREGSPRVVLTGAAGRIGRSVTEHLAGRWDLVLTDTRGAQDVDGLTTLDVSDLDACRAVFTGADAVVHLAANPAPDATFDELISPNLVGPYAVARAAAEAGVRRLVLASSLHAVSGLPDAVQRRTGDRPRPANLYGATKAWSEAVGAMTAATTATTVVALRIGYFHVDRPAETGDPLERTAWLSGRDAAELVRAAVEAELPAAAAGFVVANGVSANTHLVADLEQTRADLGYAPVDDAWDLG